MTGARRILLPALTAVCILSGCSGGDVTGSHPDYPRTWIADGVIVIDDEPGLRLHDISDGSIVLERIGELTVSEGDILAGSGMGGYIRRAVRIEQNGTLLRIETSPRFLVDAVIMGYDDRTFIIGPGSAEQRETSALFAGPGISLDGIVLYRGGEGSAGSVTIGRGSIAFSPAVDIGIAINGRRVTRFGVSLRGDMEIDLDVRAELPAEVRHSGVTRVATLSRPARMMIGDVPVPVTIELDILLDTVIDGSVTEPCDAGYSGSHSISAGMGFSGTWTATGGPPGMSFELPEMSVGPLSDCSIRIAVRTALRVSFYSADTAVISVDPWIGAECAILQFPVWKWHLTGGLSISRRFAPGMLDWKIPRFEAPAMADSVILDSGPYEAADHIFVREWGGPGSDRNGFDQPRGVAAGPQGSLYVTDQNNHRVVVFDRLGEYIGEWGSYGSSPGMFIFPAGIAVASDGSVLVSDSGNHRVQRFTAGGEFLGQWGGEGTGEGQFVQLEGIAAGPDSLMAVCDSGTSSFSIFTVTGVFIGRFPSVLARGAAFDAASDIYTAGCRSGGVTRTDRSGRFISTFGPDLCVTDISLDGAGNIYLLDYDLDRLEILGPGGNVISGIGSYGDGPGEFDRPGGVAVSPEGWVYIADTGNNRIQVFAPK